MISEKELLLWIEEDSDAVEGAPIRMLLVRLAMSLKTQGGADMSASLELGISEFEQGILQGMLKRLIQKNLVEVIGSEGIADLSKEEVFTESSYQVVLTSDGRVEVGEARRLFNR
jgi:hypothetical protein